MPDVVRQNYGTNTIMGRQNSPPIIVSDDELNTLPLTPHSEGMLCIVLGLSVFTTTMS